MSAPAPNSNKLPEGTDRYCDIVFAVSSYRRDYGNGSYGETRTVTSPGSYDFNTGGGISGSWRLEERGVWQGQPIPAWTVNMSFPPTAGVAYGFASDGSPVKGLDNSEIYTQSGIIQGYSNDSGGRRTGMKMFTGKESSVYRYVESLSQGSGAFLESGYSYGTPSYRYGEYVLVANSCPTTPTPTPTPISTPTPTPKILFLGNAAPPPPPPKKMNCCDCNTIATIIESQMMARDKLFENLKDHIDQRIKEEIVIHGKQLEALEVDLQPVIDRINESESNLWNGKR